MENRRDYVREPTHIELFPDTAPSLRRISGTGALIVLVTNQSAIGRGILTVGQMVSLNHAIVNSLSVIVTVAIDRFIVVTVHPRSFDGKISFAGEQGGKSGGSEEYAQLLRPRRERYGYQPN